MSRAGGTVRLDADVAVVGLGSMGAMAAWQLARDGHSVLGFERFGIGHDRSAVGAESRAFRTAYMEGPQYVPILRRARELWRELEAESGRSLLTSCGVLTVFPAAGSARAGATVSMANVLASVEQHGIAAEALDADGLAARFPQHALDGGETGLLDLEGGLLRPEFAVITANRRARALGARLLDRTDVLALEPGDGHVVVRTPAGRFTVRQVVACEGPWGGALLPSLAGAVQARRIVMTWFDALDPARFTPDVFPVFAREVADRAFFGVPTLDGGSVKVATLAEERDTSPDAVDRGVSVDEAERIAESVARYLPGLNPYPHRTAVQMDGFTADSHPVVGAVPGADGVWVLTGFSGHGFKMATAMGRIAADLVRDGGTDLPIDAFDPRRFAAPSSGAVTRAAGSPSPAR